MLDPKSKHMDVLNSIINHMHIITEKNY